MLVVRRSLRHGVGTAQCVIRSQVLALGHFAVLLTDALLERETDADSDHDGAMSTRTERHRAGGPAQSGAGAEDTLRTTRDPLLDARLLEAHGRKRRATAAGTWKHPRLRAGKRVR